MEDDVNPWHVPPPDPWPHLMSTHVTRSRSQSFFSPSRQISGFCWPVYLFQLFDFDISCPFLRMLWTSMSKLNNSKITYPFPRVMLLLAFGLFTIPLHKISLIFLILHKRLHCGLIRSWHGPRCGAQLGGGEGEFPCAGPAATLPALEVVFCQLKNGGAKKN